MNFTIVADKKLQRQGRALVHAISSQESHRAALSTVRRYVDNEAQVTGRNRVIFLGESKVAKDYCEFLPIRFEWHETRCWCRETKAVIAAETPVWVKREALKALRESLLDCGSSSRVAGKSDLKTTKPVDVPKERAIQAVIDNTLNRIKSPLRALRRRKRYREMQYAYGIARFLDEVFDEFAKG